MDLTQKHITVLTTNALGFPPIVFHKAIRFKRTDGKYYVLHQTTSGIEILSFENFMKGRHIYTEKNYPIRYNFNPEQIVQEDKKTFDWMGYNCEDFTSEVIESACGKTIRPKSPQRVFWISVVAIAFIILIIWKRKNK